MAPNADRYDLFAACAPGAESICRAEVAALGHAEARAISGGVTFRGNLADVARANLWLRTASRVLLRLGEFDAPGRRELGSRARRLPLDPFIRREGEVSIHVTARKSALYHTGLIAEVIQEATGLTAAGADAGAPQLFVRLDHDRCVVSIDTSGELLHRRGYRQDVSHAPLRETLAATLLLLCRYDGSEPFLDPMCGSGTIPLEAWLIATRRAPGHGRAFAFESFPANKSSVLAELRATAAAQARPPPCQIIGSDVHAGALAAARRNAERIGAADILWERNDVARRTAPSEKGLLIANPPYGKRVGGRPDRSADDSMEALAHAVGGAFRGWRTGVLLPARATLKAPGRVAKEHRLDNGGIPVKLLELT